MNEKQVNTLMKTIYAVSSLMVLIGAFLKLMHYANGIPLLLCGFFIGAICSVHDIGRLKKRIKLLDEELAKNRKKI